MLSHESANSLVKQLKELKSNERIDVKDEKQTAYHVRHLSSNMSQNSNFSGNKIGLGKQIDKNQTMNIYQSGYGSNVGQNLLGSQKFVNIQGKKNDKLVMASAQKK